MKRRKTDWLFLGLSIGGYTAMAASFVLMPLDRLQFVPGVLFWIGLALGISMQIALEARRKAFYASYRVKLQKVQKRTVGLVSFGANPEAMAADILLAISLLGLILAWILTKGYGFVCYALISVVTLSFCLHCIFNGRIYLHIKKQDKLRQALDAKLESISGKGEGKK